VTIGDLTISIREILYALPKEKASSQHGEIAKADVEATNSQHDAIE
jgi:hypothetical protein